MKNTIQELIQSVSVARSRFLENIADITETQARWKPDPEVWNIIEITEHLFWAEQGAIFGTWKTLHAIRIVVWRAVMNLLTRICPLSK